MSTALNMLTMLADRWRGRWYVDAHDGVSLTHPDGVTTSIDDMDNDARIELVDLLNAIRPAVDECRAEIARLTAELAAARAVPADVEARAWCVECDVDILSDGNSGERCDWLVFIYGEEDAREARDRAIDRLVDEGHAADAEAAERMVRIVPLVPFRRAIAEARQPSTVGGLLAAARCSCTHEAGDSRCDAHPSCSECGTEAARPVDGCEACRGPLPKGG
ncbi:MAG: hypothetical protein KBD62_38010 [Kofleriaceae bacterium]|nr:hypothetical protein [Kofleriaceae bacterium]